MAARFTFEKIVNVGSEFANETLGITFSGPPKKRICPS